MTAERGDDALAIFDAAVRSVRPIVLFESLDFETVTTRPLDAYSHVWVLGLGKAALAMASATEARLGERVDGGFVATARGYQATLPAIYSRPRRIEIGEGGHPFPDAGSVRSAHRTLQIADRAGEDDLVIVLISGGGSSVCTAFRGHITLEDARATFRLLLEAGLDIHAVNAVRKQMSAVAGGRLARAAHPAEVVSLIISDVVGDDIGIIAGGPTLVESGNVPSSPQKARAVLKHADLWDAVPGSVRDLLMSESDETAEEPHIATHHILASNETALSAAGAAARDLGYKVEIIERALTGEAREVGSRLVEHVVHSREASKPCCYLAGGESSVTVRGTGRGGRNQEMALAAAVALFQQPAAMTFLSAGTDGIDGPTDAAGAVVTQRTIAEAHELGLDPSHYLDENDSYSFFESVGGLIRIGPTHTNVMDVQIILV